MVSVKPQRKKKEKNHFYLEAKSDLAFDIVTITIVTIQGLEDFH